MTDLLGFQLDIQLQEKVKQDNVEEMVRLVKMGADVNSLIHWTVEGSDEMYVIADDTAAINVYYLTFLVHIYLSYCIFGSGKGQN